MAVVGLGDQVYVGRQAVFDSRRRVMGYELLYRHGTENRAIVSDGVEATRSVVAAAMMEFGLEHLVRDGLAFVNVTREFLATGMHRALPPDRVVLEVLEDEVADADLIELLGAVRAEGYRLALDDFTVGSDHGRLIGLAEIVKVDLLATPRDRLAGLVVDLRSRGVTVLAEKVETPADLEAVRGLGVDLVQGFFFQRPEVLAGRKVSIGELPAVRLLASVDDPDVSAVELETIIVCDPALTYRLLRLANSPAAGTTRPVTSLRGALVLLGRQTIKNLAVLAMIHGAEGKTSELATTAMVRAKMCEQLAVPTSAGSAPAAFLVGLLSVLDAVFDAPIAGLVEQLAFERGHRGRRRRPPRSSRRSARHRRGLRAGRSRVDRPVGSLPRHRPPGLRGGRGVGRRHHENPRRPRPSPGRCPRDSGSRGTIVIGTPPARDSPDEHLHFEWEARAGGNSRALVLTSPAPGEFPALASGRSPRRQGSSGCCRLWRDRGRATRSPSRRRPANSMVNLMIDFWHPTCGPGARPRNAGLGGHRRSSGLQSKPRKLPGEP